MATPLLILECSLTRYTLLYRQTVESDECLGSQVSVCQRLRTPTPSLRSVTHSNSESADGSIVFYRPRHKAVEAVAWVFTVYRHVSLAESCPKDETRTVPNWRQQTGVKESDCVKSKGKNEIWAKWKVKRKREKWKKDGSNVSNRENSWLERAKHSDMNFIRPFSGVSAVRPSAVFSYLRVVNRF